MTQPHTVAWSGCRSILCPSLFRSILLVLAVVQAGCVSTGRTLPQGAGTPYPEYEMVFERATNSCRRVRTMQLAIAIKSQTGSTRRSGDLLGALARPSSLRLVGVAAFGSPGFVLVAAPDSSVLLLPRDRRVVTGATAHELLAALAGLELSADGFRAVLTGCVVPDPRPRDSRVHESGWIAVTMDGEATVYIDTVDGTPVVVAGTRPGLTVWYSNHVRGLPRRIDVHMTDSTGVATELTATLSQVSINIELNPEAFVAQIRQDYIPMTLDQFRVTMGPLVSSSDIHQKPQ